MKIPTILKTNFKRTVYYVRSLYNRTSASASSFNLTNSFSIMPMTLSKGPPVNTCTLIMAREVDLLPNRSAFRRFSMSATSFNRAFFSSAVFEEDDRNCLVWLPTCRNDVWVKPGRCFSAAPETAPPEMMSTA